MVMQRALGEKATRPRLSRQHGQCTPSQGEITLKHKELKRALKITEITRDSHEKVSITVDAIASLRDAYTFEKSAAILEEVVNSGYKRGHEE
jgi:hypothetical protein